MLSVLPIFPAIFKISPMFSVFSLSPLTWQPRDALVIVSRNQSSSALNQSL